MQTVNENVVIAIPVCIVFYVLEDLMTICIKNFKGKQNCVLGETRFYIKKNQNVCFSFRVYRRLWIVVYEDHPYFR